jgi:hypothetical protein
MTRIFENKTTEEVSITCDNLTQIIPGGEQFDLATVFTMAQLQACDHLVELLGQGVDKYALDDGSGELAVATAIDLVRCIHQSEMRINTGKASSDGSPLFAMDCPTEDDKKIVMVNSPATEGTFTWLSARGDNLTPTPPSSGRGDGAHLMLSFTEPDTKEVEAQFCEPIELHDGHISWRPTGDWDFEDSWSISVRMPATVAVVNPTNTGNCNLYPTGQGFNIIVPAAGDGAYDVDLSQAVPIPDGYSAKTEQGAGYWNVEEHWSEEITPNGSDKGAFNLYDIQLEMFFCKNMDCGNPLGIWDLDAYKAEWVSKKWKLCFQATKVTAGAGKIGGYLMIFRPGAL